MAKTNNDRPLAELTEQSKRELDAIMAEVDAADDDIAALAEAGVDVSRLKERVNWARNAVTIVRKRFT